MRDMLLNNILFDMSKYINNYQLEKLKETINHHLYNLEVIKQDDSNILELDYNKLFLSSKKLEGCSIRTVEYYDKTVNDMLSEINKNIKLIDTNDIRNYLSNYQSNHNCSNVTIDNIRRIHKIKTQITVKETYSDENLEKLRDGCHNIRDLAMIDFLSSTGVRVGELVNLNIDDIDFINQSCVVLGKGNKEREVYFDARAKLHLLKYLESRTDNNSALFVSLIKPYNRLNISGVEIRLRTLGKKLNITRVHPHKFRRTLATKAIDKGMPIEQVQKLLGHTKIDTTMHYAMVSQSNVKVSHHRYIC